MSHQRSVSAWKTRLFVGAALLFLMLLAACQYVIGLGDPASDQRPPDGGPDTYVVPQDAGTDPCNHVFPPPPPSVDDDPIGVKGPFTMAMRTVQLLQRLGYDAGAFGGGGGDSGYPVPLTAFGFDLDNACTCERDRHHGAGSCISANSTSEVCDGDGGVDNALGAALTDLQVFGNVDTLATINKRIAGGESSVLVTIQNYNGLANDQDVQATLSLVARPLRSPDPSCTGALPRPAEDDGGGADGGDQDYSPAWDGCDVWQVVEQGSIYTGYVVNHQLVVTTNSEANVPVGTATVRVRSPMAVGTLIPDGNGGFTLEDAIFAGRAPQDAMFAAIMTFKIAPILGGTDVPACFTSEYVALFRTRFCPGLDIMDSPSEDFGPDGGYDCNSISFTFAFRAQKAAQGPPTAVFPVGDCADSGADLTCFPDSGATSPNDGGHD